jgi:hypothetical protein
MGAKVFISCGLARPNERAVAECVAKWFNSEGFEAYVAVTVQTIMDLNAGVIGALKNSDYYLFINFRREKVIGPPDSFRGSLYTHQELAVAYALGFDRMILVNQSGTAIEGVLQFIVTNTPRFETEGEVLGIVKDAVRAEHWLPAFSRQLTVEQVAFAYPPTLFHDHATLPQGRPCLFLHGYVANRRPDIAARQTICRLCEISSIVGPAVVHEDFTPLKATGFTGYEQTIWPSSVGRFDLLSIHYVKPNEIFLHSLNDMGPRRPAISSVGRYKLIYEILAEHFPQVRFAVELEVTGAVKTTKANLVPV